MTSGNKSQQTATPKTAALIRQRIQKTPRGRPFIPSDFSDCGKRAAIDQTLRRAAEEGVIKRVTRGVYVRPEISRYVGEVSPASWQVAEAVARNVGDTIQPHGAVAINQLGLSTQVPVQPVFGTSGRSREIQVGESTIRLYKAPQREVKAWRKLKRNHPLAGLALIAMRYLGKQELSAEVVAQIRRKLGDEEFAALWSVFDAMPSWMQDVILQERDIAANA